MNTEKVIEEKVIELGKVSEETKGTGLTSVESPELVGTFGG
jgi:hypothetical protein